MKEMKRILSLFLCLVMLVGYIPVGALAADGDDATEPTEGAVVETTVPETTVPETTVPETTVPETTVPETTVPETTVPETTVPETTVSETTEPADKPAPKPVRKPVSMGMMGTTVSKKEAAGEVKVASRANDSMLTAAIFFGDVRGNTAVMKSVLTTIGGNGVSYETIGLVGNTAGAMADVTAAAKAALGQEPEVVYAWGSQDAESDISEDSALLYSGDDYYIYHISEAHMGSAADADAVSAEIAEFQTALETMDKTKVLFIMSNAPLHADEDNAYAGQWYAAVAEAADAMDVVFFWSGNADEYYVAKNGSETMTVDGVEVTPNFTYMNAGYMDGEGQRKGVATTVELFEDTIVFQDYTASGEYKDENCAHNVTVEREFEEEPAPAETEETTAPALVDLKVTYSKELLLSGELVLSVAAVYEDGTTKDLSQEEYQVATNFARDINASQVYVVSYGEQSHAFLIARDAATGVAVVADEMEELTVADVTNDEAVIAAVADTFTGAFAAYDITPDQYNTENSPAVVSMPAPEGANAVFYWNRETNELEPVEDAVFENGKVVFTTDHFSPYIVGNVEITEEPSNNVPLGGLVEVEKTIYKRAATISANKAYLIVNANAAGDAYALANNNGSVAATLVTIGRDTSNELCIVLDDDADERWTASAAINQNTSGTLKNRDHYLRITDGGKLDLTQTGTDNYISWRYNTSNQLYRYRRNMIMGSDTDYLRYNVDWTASSSSSEATPVYFYEAVMGTVMENGTINYSMRAANVTQIDPVTNKTAVIDYCLQGNGEDLTTLPSGGSYSFTVTEKDAAKPIITSVSNGTITFTGEEGEAAVKVAYTWTDDDGQHVVYKYIKVKTVAPYYVIEITEGVADKDNNITYTVVPSGKILAKKNVTSETQLLLGTDGGLKRIDDANLEDDAVDTTTYQLVWTSSDEKIATVAQNGTVSFKSITENGTVQITVTAYAVEKGQVTNTVMAKDTVTVTASPNAYYTPEDGKEQMPDYPGAGAVVIDKNAKAVGNFNETGIAQIELSMFGVPSGGKPVDVILVVDKSVSMDDYNRSQNAETAAVAFVDTLKTNPENRLAIVTYSNEKTDVMGPEIFALQELTPEHVTEAYRQIDTFSEGTGQATNYVAGLSKAQSILDGIQNDRQKFVVFLSDGAPSSYMAMDNETYDLTNGRGGPTDYWIDSSGQRNTGVTEGSGWNNNEKNWRYEYYTTQMKAAGITVYTVGLGLNATQPKLVLNDMSGPAGETEQPDQPGTGTTKKKDKYYFEVEDDNAATELAKVFEGIAAQISAASNVAVKDLVTKDYSVVFQKPSAVNTDKLPANQEFYLEIVKYTLDANHERTGEKTTVQKIYMIESDGQWLASSTNNADGALTKVTDLTAELKDNEVYYYNNASEDTLHFKTKYFEYNAQATHSDGETYAKLDWNADTLSDKFDMAIRYFVYLDGSVEGNLESGPYATNKEATISYTNHLGNLCTQKFPVPQMTWNGAQVSYTFYLVDDDGKPINQSGVPVDFRAAVFVTDTFTEHVTWNDAEGITSLKVNTIASKKLPAGYELYDPAAEYNLHVYENTGYFKYDPNTGEKLEADVNEDDTIAEFNWFEIVGSNEGLKNYNTTKVYSTLGGARYDAKGVYTDADESVKTINYTYYDENGWERNGTKDVQYPNSTAVDIYATTVAFAVKWNHKVMDDTVVVDYGLPVKIDVVKNDLLQNEINGIGLVAPAATNAIYDESDFTKSIEVPGVYTAVHDKSFVTFTQKSMEFKEPVEFYYDTAVTYSEGGDEHAGFMCAKVTVIPATTIYYEDSFVDFTNSDSATETEPYGKWVDVGTETYATQDQDRPGLSQISKDLDADNVYGYDSAYETMSEYSLGTAKKICVNANNAGLASFEFYGTGFDVISMTDNTTGTIMVRVYDDANERVYSAAVDTYYGYTYEGGKWTVVDADSADALYQVPVIKVTGLSYLNENNQPIKYRVEIIALYGALLDHQGTGSYNYYMDAVRIYDPAGTTYDVKDADGNVITEGNIHGTIQNAYIADGEGWPVYEELRNNVINASDFEDDIVNGIVFVDGVGETTVLSDYIGYGPNNELYLAPNQYVVFALNLEGYNANVAKVQLGLKSADGKPVNYAIVDAEKVETVDTAAKTVKTSTSMYYDITDLKDKYIVVCNNDGGILSLTDIKITFESAPTIVDENLFYVDVNTIMNVLKNLQTITPEVPDEEDIPMDLTAELPEYVKVGSEFEVKVSAIEAEKVTVTTSDVDATVNVAQSQIDEGVWIAKVTSKKEGTLTVTVTATADGYEDTTVVANVLVYSYTPAKFEVTYAPSTPRANSPFVIDVTTDENVAAVRIDGKLVTTYQENGEDRVWTKTVTRGEGKCEISVIAYNQEGHEDEKTVTIEVKAATRTVAQRVKDTVSSIAKSLMSWFKK